MHRGKFLGPEPLRLAVLKFAAVLGAPAVDLEYLAAEHFFAGAVLLAPCWCCMPHAKR